MSKTYRPTPNAPRLLPPTPRHPPRVPPEPANAPAQFVPVRAEPIQPPPPAALSAAPCPNPPSTPPLSAHSPSFSLLTSLPSLLAFPFRPLPSPRLVLPTPRFTPRPVSLLSPLPSPLPPPVIPASAAGTQRQPPRLAQLATPTSLPGSRQIPPIPPARHPGVPSRDPAAPNPSSRRLRPGPSSNQPPNPTQVTPGNPA